LALDSVAIGTGSSQRMRAIRNQSATIDLLENIGEEDNIVSVHTLDRKASEDQSDPDAPPILEFRRSGSTDEPLEVRFDIVASAGIDAEDFNWFTLMLGFNIVNPHDIRFTFEAGEATKLFIIDANDDWRYEPGPGESLIIEVLAPAPGMNEYHVHETHRADWMYIEDNDSPDVEIGRLADRLRQHINDWASAATTHVQARFANEILALNNLRNFYESNTAGAQGSSTTTLSVLTIIANAAASEPRVKIAIGLTSLALKALSNEVVASGGTATYDAAEVALQGARDADIREIEMEKGNLITELEDSLDLQTAGNSLAALQVLEQKLNAHYPTSYAAPPPSSDLFAEMLIAIAAGRGWNIWYDAEWKTDDWADGSWWDAPDFVEQLNAMNYQPQ